MNDEEEEEEDDRLVGCCCCWDLLFRELVPVGGIVVDSLFLLSLISSSSLSTLLRLGLTSIIGISVGRERNKRGESYSEGRRYQTLAAMNRE